MKKNNWKRNLKIRVLRTITINLRAWMNREGNTLFRDMYYDCLNDWVLPSLVNLEQAR